MLLPVLPAAALVPPVETHELHCDNGFPCPEAIRRRVDFWIKVFRSWTTEQVMFHDPRHTERVYSVIQAPEGCGRRRGPAEVEQERARLREMLNRIADHLDNGASDHTEAELALLGLFPGADAGELRRAAAEVRCQGGNRDRFAEALSRYGQYRVYIARTLREQGLSEDIQYLPFVESAYNPRALSRVGAAGLWQIMPKTARTLGLQLNAAVDERYDPQRSTQAAARYLRGSGDDLLETARTLQPDVGFEQLSPFIITSYNYGVAGTTRALGRVGPDYVALLRDYEAGGFGNAVKNFYASFLAARYVARNADRYFDGVAEVRPPKTTVVPVRTATSVADAQRLFGVTVGDLRELNPALTGSVWRGARKIPAGYHLQVPARRSGLTEQVANLEALPELAPRARPTTVIKPAAAAEPAAAATAGEAPAPTPDPEAGAGVLARVAQEIERGAKLEEQGGVFSLRVQPEETLGHYADWLGIGSAQEIRRRNKMRDNNVVLGARIVVPVGGEEQRRRFEERRVEFHRALVQQLQERYEFVRLEPYKVKKSGISLRAVAQDAGAPSWLLHWLNPKATRLSAGATLEVPVLKLRAGKTSGWRMSR